MKKYIPILFVLLSLQSCYTAKFTTAEQEILYGENEQGRLPVFLVSNPSDSIVLYAKSKKIKAEATNSELKRLTDLMLSTMRDPGKPGVGIAAPQVGINRKIIWVQRFDKEGTPFELYFNIKILNYSEERKNGIEGCLSVDNYYGTVNRAAEIKIKYDTFAERHITETVKGYTAVIFQHEIDHLNGILYTDRIEDK